MATNDEQDRPGTPYDVPDIQCVTGPPEYQEREIAYEDTDGLTADDDSARQVNRQFSDADKERIKARFNALYGKRNTSANDPVVNSLMFASIDAYDNGMHDGRDIAMEQGATPNVVIRNPKVRKALNSVLAGIGITLAVVMGVDGVTEAFDLTAYTYPAFVGYGILAGAFGIAVVNANIPRSPL